MEVSHVTNNDCIDIFIDGVLVKQFYKVFHTDGNIRYPAQCFIEGIKAVNSSAVITYS